MNESKEMQVKMGNVTISVTKIGYTTYRDKGKRAWESLFCMIREISLIKRRKKNESAEKECKEISN